MDHFCGALIPDTSLLAGRIKFTVPIIVKFNVNKSNTNRRRPVFPGKIPGALSQRRADSFCLPIRG